MIGNIKRYNGMSSGGGGEFNPDDMFDENHVATEENFIQLLDHEVYDSKYIGYKVQLSNSCEYDNGLWVIADVDHDSANTGQTNCYDLISQDCFYNTKFGTNATNCYWYMKMGYNSVRNWLNSSFYEGFSDDFKVHMLDLKHHSNNYWIESKLIIPCCKELGGLASSTYQGTTYSILSGGSAKVKLIFGTSTKGSYWTRESGTNSNQYYVDTSGSLVYQFYQYYAYVAPIMRVQ